MELGQAYADALPATHRHALGEAAVVLIDVTLENLESSGKPGWSAEDWLIGGLLPRRYMSRYTAGFARKFFVCLVTVVWKLAQPEPIQLSCVAEELAASILIKQAELVLELRGEEADFGAFEDAFFEDLDFELLYSGAYDGIEETEFGKEEMGIVNLAIRDWFKGFGPDFDHPEVHPYAQEEDKESPS